MSKDVGVKMGDLFEDLGESLNPKPVMHKDYHLDRVDLDRLIELKRDFINTLMANNIRYSAISHISAILNNSITDWEKVLDNG